MSRICKLACLLLLTTGCGDNVVTGKVLLDEKPLVHGTVVLVDNGGIPRYGTIKEDGAYTIKGPASGSARIAVTSPDLGKVNAEAQELFEKRRKMAGLPEQKLPPIPAGWFPIPARYGDPESSALTLTVRWGRTEHDIRLQSD